MYIEKKRVNQKGLSKRNYKKNLLFPQIYKQDKIAQKKFPCVFAINLPQRYQTKKFEYSAHLLKNKT